MVIYLIICLAGMIICGVISKNINEGKGYEGGFWWGFFLGIIGIIVVACKTDKRIIDSVEKTYRSEVQNNESKNSKTSSKSDVIWNRLKIIKTNSGLPFEPYQILYSTIENSLIVQLIIKNLQVDITGVKGVIIVNDIFGESHSLKPLDFINFEKNGNTMTAKTTAGFVEEELAAAKSIDFRIEKYISGTDLNVLDENTELVEENEIKYVTEYIEDDRLRCPYCGTEQRKNRTFCYNCSKELIQK